MILINVNFIGFQTKLELYVQHLEIKNFTHFDNLSNELTRQEVSLESCQVDEYVSSIVEIQSQIKKRFSEFKSIEPVVSFILNPFKKVDNMEFFCKSLNHFKYNMAELEIEIIDFQADLNLKAAFGCENFWVLVSCEKYPNILDLAYSIHSLFASTYLCESAFSSMKLIKSKLRNNLTNDHLQDSLRLALTNYTPDYTTLVNNMESKISH